MVFVLTFFIFSEEDYLKHGVSWQRKKFPIHTIPKEEWIPNSHYKIQQYFSDSQKEICCCSWIIQWNPLKYWSNSSSILGINACILFLCVGKSTYSFNLYWSRNNNKIIANKWRLRSRIPQCYKIMTLTFCNIIGNKCSSIHIDMCQIL